MIKCLFKKERDEMLSEMEESKDFSGVPREILTLSQIVLSVKDWRDALEGH